MTPLAVIAIAVAGLVLLNVLLLVGLVLGRRLLNRRNPSDEGDAPSDEPAPAASAIDLRDPDEVVLPAPVVDPVTRDDPSEGPARRSGR